MALKHLFDPAIEAFDHPVCLGRFGRGQAVFDLQRGAQLVDLMRPCGSLFAHAEQAVCELFTVVREDRANAHWASPLQITQKTSRVGRSLVVVDPDKDPTCGSVDGYKEVTALCLVLHLRQIFHIDVKVTRFIGFEGLMLWFWALYP